MDKLVILILLVLGVFFSSFAQIQKTGDRITKVSEITISKEVEETVISREYLKYEWEGDYQIAYVINDKKYYGIDADTLTIVNLNVGRNYMVVAVATNSPYPKPAYLLDPEFKIPMKWDARRRDWNSFIYYFYTEPYHIKVPPEEMIIKLVYMDSPYSADVGDSRKLMLKVRLNNKPKIGFGQEFEDCVCPPLDPIIIE